MKNNLYVNCITEIWIKTLLHSSKRRGRTEKYIMHKRMNIKNSHLSSQRGGRIADPQMFLQQNFHNLENLKPHEYSLNFLGARGLLGLANAPIVVRMVREKKQDWM